MTTYNTGNGIGSIDPRDLLDNAQNLDEALLTESATFVDRLGRTRSSWEGAVKYSVLSETYSAGLEVTTRNQIIFSAGEWWAIAGSESLPYTTTGAGMPEGGAFQSVGDAKLRGELVQPVATFNNVADMVAATELTVGRKVRWLGYYTPGDGGGNDGEVVAAGTGVADGGSYIDLTGSGLQAKGLFIAGYVNVKQFGAVGDGVSDDIGPITAARAYTESLIFFPIGTYRISSGTFYRAKTLFAKGAKVVSDVDSSLDLAPDVLKISDYLSVYSSGSDALKAAIVRLLGSSSQALDLEGRRIILDKPVVIRPSDVQFNSNFAEDCLVFNGWFQATNTLSLFSSGDALFDITRATAGDGQLIRNFKFSDVVFDCSNISQVIGVKIASYYNFQFNNCQFRNFTHVAAWSTGQASDGTLEVSNGLTFNHCNWTGVSGDNGASGTRKAALLYDTDVVFNGGFIEWVNTGIDAHLGSVRVEGTHFSMGDTSGYTPAAMIFRDPRNINITSPDIDGGVILLTNDGNFYGAAVNGYTNWRGIVISDVQGDFSSLQHKPGYGLVNFVTVAANTTLRQTYISGGEWAVFGAGDNAINQVAFIESGSGTFTSKAISNTSIKGFGVVNDNGGALSTITDNFKQYPASQFGASILGGTYNGGSETLTLTPTSGGSGMALSNGLTVQWSSSIGDTTAAVRLYRGTSNVLQVKGNGDVQNTNNSYGALSDITIKNIIGPASSQWDDIKNVNWVKYTLNDDYDKLVQIGVIAQELEIICPGLVTEDPDTGLKSVKYSILFTKAMVALQEAMNRIESLESAINKGN